MKIRALAVAAVLAGCSQQVPTYSTSSGGLALSNDDSLLYAVDPDSNQLFVVDAHTDENIAAVKVGAQPEKVVVGKDDTVFVSNRMGRSVSVIHRGDWKEATRLDTGVEPAGMAINGDQLLVVNATKLDDASVGSLMAFDTRSLTMLWETPVGHEPRAVAVSGNTAFVSLYKDGDIATVDLKSHQVLNGGKTDTLAKLNKNALDPMNAQFQNSPTPTPDGRFFGRIAQQHPRGVESLTVSPDGQQVYASTLLSSDTVLPSQDIAGVDNKTLPGGGAGDGYGGGSCGAGSVTTPAVLTFDGNGNSLASDVSGCGGQRQEGVPAQVLTSGNITMPIQGPSATVVDPTGAFIFVTGRESNNVAILPTNAASTQDQNNITVDKEPVPQGSFEGFNGGGSVHTTVMVGAGPSGIALSHDGKTAYVLNAFDHTISRLERKDGVVQQTHAVQFTSETLPADVVAGRKLFFSATDSRMTASTTGISCASCHLEGREDGHVWNFTDGPRQTPSLAGRMLSKTAPFHWNGEFDGLTSFMAQTVNHRMGGTGVTAAMEQQIAAFIDSQPTPDNPHRTATLNAQQLRGQAAFAKAQCNNCHKGETLTDNSFQDVGTYVQPVIDPATSQPSNVFDNVSRFIHGGLNTPSLLGVARTAPYLHDGSAQTLKQRITNGQADSKHGATASLSDGEVDDLVEYLKTL